MQQIAEEVGLHKTSLYHHISSKQSLLVSIAEFAMDEPLRQLEEIVADSSLDPLDKLRKAVYVHVLEVTSRTDQIAAFTMYVQEIEDTRSRRKFVNRRNKYGHLFQALVAECLEVEPESPEAEMVSFGILGMSNWMLHWYQPGGAYSAEELANCFADMALRSATR